VTVKGTMGSLQTSESKEYGASYAALQLAKELQLDTAIYSKASEQWVKDCLALIIGRLVYAGSKLACLTGGRIPPCGAVWSAGRSWMWTNLL